MINKLRKKFIAIAMLSVSAVLIIIVGAINLMNYGNVVSDADRAIEMIEDNGGTLPVGPGGNAPGADESGDRSTPPGNAAPAEDAEPNGDPPASIKDHERAEMPFDTRYFTVTFDSNGKAVDSNYDNIAALGESDAEKLAKGIFDGDKEKGFKGNYRFRKADSDGGTMVIAVDCYRGLGNFRSFLLYSLLVSVLGIMSVFVLVLVLSKRAVRPVAESYEKQKEFITDAGHELKTPLTVIEADCSVMEMESGKSEWTDDIKAQTKRLTDLTNELIYLSKMDEGRGLEKMEFPVSDVAREITQSFTSKAKVEGKELAIEIEDGISYEGDEKLIRELVSILVDNAVKYCDAGGRITVSLKKQGDGVVLATANTAKNVGAGDLGPLFDRFYRADRSREEKKGFGLGLSIAKAVCEAHNGSIRAEKKGDEVLFICRL